MKTWSPLLLALSLAGCGGETDWSKDVPVAEADGSALHAALFTDAPVERGVNTGVLKLSSNGGSAEGLQLTVTPWMPAMGHGSSVTPTVTADAQGNYDVSQIYLAMPGTWQLRVEASGPVTDAFALTFDVP